MKTVKFLSMAALVLMGTILAGCAKIEQNTAPLAEDNIVVCTATINMDADGTKALTNTGVKTFAEGDKIAVIYKNTSNQTIKAESDAISSGVGTNSATFSVTLTNPDNTKAIRYIYPAAMAKETVETDATIDDLGTVDFTKLNTQDGTLTTLGNNLDLCTFDAANWTSGELPTGSMTNQFAILAITLKDNAATPTEITGSITGITISDGTNTYIVSRTAAAGPIYVAIRPTASSIITMNANSSTTNYTKTLAEPKTYAANNGYSVSWKMTQGTNLSLVTANHTANDGDMLTGALASYVKISIADGATVMLDGVSINASGSWTSGDYAGITCAGDATITLEGTNTVKGFDDGYPGIFVSSGKTLVINGTGELIASSNGSYDTGSGGAGIGGGDNMNCGNIEIQSGTVTATGNQYGAGIGGGQNANCGNITISGGTVTATGGYRAAGIGGGRRGTGGTSGQYNSGSCGNITISGGTVTATGGQNAAGIGGGRGNNNNYKSSCGTITITSGVTSVTATKGSGADNSIGAGNVGICGTVTIEAGANVTQN